MDLKKSGRIILFLIGCFAIGSLTSTLMAKKKFPIYEQNQISFENYISRLSEFDLTEEKLSTELFLGLVNDGVSFKEAFEATIKASYDYGWII